MKQSTELFLAADATLLLEVLADLSTYPSWNDLVTSAVPEEPENEDPGPVWRTTLRAQVGPFARSKQLRFTRAHVSSTAEHHTIRFDRRELDERAHAPWTMEVEVEPTGETSRVTLTLNYGGGLWVPALGSVLGGAIERATVRLPDYLESR